MAADVLFVSYSGVLGGAERILLDCATRLGSPAAVACPDGPLADAARGAGLPVHGVRARPIALRAGAGAAARHAAGLAGLAVETGALVHRARPAALVAWGMRAILATALPPRRPPVLAVHNDFVPPGAVGRAVRGATRRADRVLALSEAIAASLGATVRAAPGRAAAGPPRTVAVLHPGVDLAAWRPFPPPDGPPRALVLGALVPWKAPHLALEIAAGMPELHVDLAGAPMPGDDGTYVAGLRRRASAPDLAGRVRLLGAVADPRPLLRDSHLLLHCGREPYGLALVEALAAGRPLVAPAAGGPLEILRDTPRAGRLYEQGDQAGAVRAIRSVLADPAAGAAARALAEARFDVEAAAARFAAVLAGIAA